MSEHNELSQTQNVGENNPTLNINAPEGAENDENPALSPFLERQRQEMEQRFEEEHNQNNPMEPDNRGKHLNEVGDAPKPKSDQVSFKTFKSCGATEYAGQSDPELAMQWIQNTEKVFQITEFDVGRIQKRFFEQYCPIDLQRRLEKEFLDLKQGKMTILDYETEFNKKARFVQRFLSSEQDKIEHFIGGLRKEIRSVVVTRDVSSFSKIVEYVQYCEYELSIPDDNESMSKRPQTERMMSTPTQRRAHQEIVGGAKRHTKAGVIQIDLLLNAFVAVKVLGHRIKDCPRIKKDESKALVQQPTRVGTSTQKEEVPRAQARAFQITAAEALKEPDVVTGIFLLNDTLACILFDSGAINSFVSLYYTQYLDFVPIMLEKPFNVDTANRVTLVADKVYKDCKLDLDDHEFTVDLIPMDIHNFDVVIGIDWLMKNRADIICSRRMIQISMENGEFLYVYGE
ncbi:uncharacterized protein LOC112510818 [Cynara cardunculus var. scolymus]|uniref:uncharacterized protein LOC112510818 n=1 Tax=Cynara cardunculus var. scolymus TaxID=59895 RepID=UPI000D628561|nr:uncharacterized protein LOC112510818 [Cynara cardunculus var. scolymus]